MADLGQPRPVASTPLEYAPAAARVAQDGRDDVFLLTDVYNEVRYSAGVSATSAAAARAAWQRLRDRLEHVAAGR
jgi:hypothetical protein